MQDPDVHLINNRGDLDFLEQYNRVYVDAEVNDDPYFGVNIQCKFHNLFTLSQTVNKSIFISINIQSLQSKHEQLVEFIHELSKFKIDVDVIAVQETWEVRYLDLVNIPGFKPLIAKTRQGMRGGGVGFYIRNNLNATIIDNLSPFTEKIFESITIQLTYPASNKSILLTSGYRSNGVIPNMTQTQQMDEFFEMFGELLLQLQQTNKESYIFMDANINLLDLNSPDVTNYINLLFAAGYLQSIAKATRIQNVSKSLIDHIHVNSNVNEIVSGVLISDISDHFFTFICPQSSSPITNKHKVQLSRDFSLPNLNKFKTELGLADWTNVTSSNEVDMAYECFWTTYKNLYETNFPLKRKRFNKNFNSINKFMTPGLIISRRTKNSLHATSVSDPTVLNINRYKAYKTVYQRVIRAAKKLHIANKITENASNPKKTWETLNELLGKNRNMDSISQIKINDGIETDYQKIVNKFNSFFTNIGKQISNSVPPVTKKPEDYIDYGREIPSMHLGNTTPAHVLKTIKKFKAKNSCDINGVSSKMIKFVGPEIATPLAHIFNLSLSTGQFPSHLKQCRVIPIFKAGDRLDCDNYRPISLLSSISKVLEKIVAEKLVFHLNDNDLLYQHQYGFTAKKSAEHNLMHILNYITSALNDGMFCVGVFSRPKKSF